MRSIDLSNLDLSQSITDLLFADFDSRTVWPAADRMPGGFDPEYIAELGKSPGLGVRSLHDRGVTGRGVGIAIIDQTLLVDHEEYTNRLRLYEEADDIVGGWKTAQMHGPAVASIAVGRTVGVAPEADLYYIATAMCGSGTYESIDFGCLALSVRRILEINAQLPADRKIRVLSMSIGWGPASKGYDEIIAATEQAKADGMLVVCSSIAEVHGLRFHGLGRPPTSDPESPESYGPGLWWAAQFYAGRTFPDSLLVPMDSRTTASPSGTNEYAFYRQGGWSWCIPYIAGLYALAAQVHPAITPDQFWAAALQTGKTIQATDGRRTRPLGRIVNPKALIESLK
ncbi:MAG: hypothetical protein A49_14510 [Methyloceanibacter sp.]|nr:MAG: hypothetical protein A49_14510 [Methyloceanibacter sp.]